MSRARAKAAAASAAAATAAATPAPQPSMPMPMPMPMAMPSVGSGAGAGALSLCGSGAHLSSPLLVHVLRLGPGADLMVSLEEFVRRMRVRAACILSAVGSLTRVHLRFANVPDALAAPLPVGHYEVVSLSGMMSCDSGSHVHMSVSDSTGRTLGGHLQPRGSLVYTTMEIALGMLPAVEFAREPDATFGYNELVVYPNGTSAAMAGSVMAMQQQQGGGMTSGAASGLAHPNLNGVAMLPADAAVPAPPAGSKRKVSEGEDSKAGKKAKAATGKKAKEAAAMAAAAAASPAAAAGQMKEEPGASSEEKSKPPTLQLPTMPTGAATSVHSPVTLMAPIHSLSPAAAVGASSAGVPSPSSSSAVTPSTSPAPGASLVPGTAGSAAASGGVLPGASPCSSASSCHTPSPSPASASAGAGARPAVGLWTTSQFSIFLKSLHLDHLVPIFQWHKVDAKQFLELGLRDIRDRLGIRDPADVANVLNCIQILRGTTLPCQTAAANAAAAAAAPTAAATTAADKNKK